MYKRCFIVGAGDFDGFLSVAAPERAANTWKSAAYGAADIRDLGLEAAANTSGLASDESDLIIAADGGYRYLQTLGVEPDILMGDFDSLEVVPEHRHLIRHSPIKDDTDMALAVAWAEEAGCETFFLYGGLGGRLDHTIANLQLLTGMARKGLEAYLIGAGSVITAVTNGRLEFPAWASGMISVFCQGEEAAGVYERGLKYTLDDAVLTCERALGVSNEFTGIPGSIEVTSGTLLVMWEAANGLPGRKI